MATKKQEILEETPQTETNPELEEMVREEMHDAEGSPPQTETEATQTDENSVYPDNNADAQGTLPQTGTEEPKKARGRKKTEEKPSESDTEAHSGEKNAGDGVEEAPKPRKRRASARSKPVVAIDERLSVETEADKAKNDLLDLLESQKTGRILTGTIQGVERPPDNPSRSLAVIRTGGIHHEKNRFTYFDTWLAAS